MLNWTGSLNIMCIYKITDIETGKIYVGQTTNFRSRLRNYKSALRKPKASGDVWWVNRLHRFGIHKDFYKDFNIDVIEVVNNADKLDEREIYWIEKLQARDPNVGYNIARGGTGKHNLIYRNRYAKALSKSGLPGIVTPKMIYIFDEKTSDIELYFSGVSADEALGLSYHAAATLANNGHRKNSKHFYYFDDILRHKIADKIIRQQKKIISKYESQRLDNPRRQDTATKSIRYLIKYLQGLVAVERNAAIHSMISNAIMNGLTEYDVELLDTTPYIDRISDEIINLQDAIPDSKDEVVSKLKRKYVECCRSTGAPMLSPNVCKGHYTPLIVYDAIDNNCRAFISKKDVIAAFNLTYDSIYDKVKTGKPFLKCHYVYFVDKKKRDDKYCELKNTRHNTAEKRSEFYQYTRGYFAADNYCEINGKFFSFTNEDLFS